MRAPRASRQRARSRSAARAEAASLSRAMSSRVTRAGAVQAPKLVSVRVAATASPGQAVRSARAVSTPWATTSVEPAASPKYTAHPQRVARGAVDVAGEPVAALAVAVGEVAPAERLGARSRGLMVWRPMRGPPVVRSSCMVCSADHRVVVGGRAGARRRDRHAKEGPAVAGPMPRSGSGRPASPARRRSDRRASAPGR